MMRSNQIAMQMATVTVKVRPRLYDHTIKRSLMAMSDHIRAPPVLRRLFDNTQNYERSE